MRLLIAVACASILVSCRPVDADGILLLGAEVDGELTDADTMGVAGMMRLQVYHVDVPAGGGAVLAHSEAFPALVSLIALGADGLQTERVGLSETYGGDPACVIVPAQRAGRYRVMVGGMANLLSENRSLPTGDYRLDVVPLSEAPVSNCSFMPDRSEREILEEHYRELGNP